MRSPLRKAAFIFAVVFFAVFLVALGAGAVWSKPWTLYRRGDWRYNEVLSYGVLGGAVYGTPLAVLAASCAAITNYRRALRTSPT
jgi:hypothetical protein